MLSRPWMILIAGMILPPTNVPASGPYPDGLYAEVETNKGVFTIELAFEQAPMTVANFVGLAEGTIENSAFPAGVPYFNGTKWHRVVAGHVIQCGVPAKGKTQGPGYAFPNEIVLPGLDHGRAGMVNMANGGPHTNGSQWCVTLGDRSYLDGDYTVFGRVVRGLDVVMAIAQGDEIRTVKVIRVGAGANAFRPTAASFKALVDAAWARVKKDDAEKKLREDALVKAEWPKAIEAGGGLKYQILRPGAGEAPAAGAKVRIAYSGRAALSGKAFVGTADGGKPYWGERPEPFDVMIGATKINPGLDAAIAAMKKGEKRLVIVPAALAYGTSGFYAVQRPNEKRFVLSPNTLLVYEVERLD
jgi:cyclophilin family peptidyl-prolyl cis-trans isomerase